MNKTKKVQIIKNIFDDLGLTVYSEQDIMEAITYDAVRTHEVLPTIHLLLKKYIEKNYIWNFNLDKTDTEGESKRIYKDLKSDLCLIRLKPTLYSFTHNRYGVVENTDKLRNSLWKVFSDEINNEVLSVLYSNTGNYSPKINQIINELKSLNALNYPLLTSYLGCINIDGVHYNICRYVHNQTPLEYVWKDYFTGTMKHNLLFVDQYKTKYGYKIEQEGLFPNEIVRFDWRNPFSHNGQRAKDEAIPDDFAEFYTNVNVAKLVVKLASNIIKEFVSKAGYKFVDTCYFINEEGNLIYSEITPDGMRLKKKGKSADKDLWRQGKDAETICSVWADLLADLKTLQEM